MARTKDYPSQLLEVNLQLGVSDQNEALEVTSVALNSEKCFWYLISYVWVGGRQILQLSEYDIDDTVNI